MNKFNLKSLVPNFLTKMSLIGLICATPIAIAQVHNNTTPIQSNAAPVTAQPIKTTLVATQPASSTITPASSSSTTSQPSNAPTTHAFPLSSTVSYDSLRIMAYSGQSEQAIKLAQEYLKTHENSSVRVLLARMLAWDKQFTAATEQLQFVLSKHPGDYDASDCLSDVYVWQSNYTGAIDVLTNALKYDPNNQGLLDKREIIKAKMLVSNSPLPTTGTTGKPTSGVTYDQLKKMAHSGQRPKAIKLAQESLKQSDNSDIRTLLGLMLSWDGRYDEARTQLEIVLKKHPSNSDAIKALANVELWSHHNKSALVVINKGLKYYPHDQDLIKQRYRALGLSSESPSYDELRKMYRSGQTEQAKQIAKEYLSKNENADIRLLLGLMESWDKNYDDARIQFETVLKHKPGYTDASLALADVDRYTGDYYRALQVINTALRYDHNDKDLLAKRTGLIQTINQTIITPGVFSLFNVAGVVGPYTPGHKLNAFIFDQEVSYVDDLKEIWKITSVGYERYTPYGPIIFTYNKTDRFDSLGNQVLIEAYPHLFPGAYMYLGYGYSPTSYLARNYVGFEPFFSLPHAYEFSLGERILQFQGGTTHLYTGSIAKYIGNYWFSFRPYYSNSGSHSYFLTARRYFSSPDSYISLTVGGGQGPSNFNFLDPNSITSNRSRSVRLNGDLPLTEDFIFTWLVEYSYDHFPTSNIRQETDVDAGFIWRF